MWVCNVFDIYNSTVCNGFDIFCLVVHPDDCTPVLHALCWIIWRLEMLYLGGNLISFIPPELANLRCLRYLVLCDNCIQSIPPQLKRLLYILNYLYACIYMHFLFKYTVYKNIWFWICLEWFSKKNPHLYEPTHLLCWKNMIECSFPNLVSFSSSITSPQWFYISSGSISMFHCLNQNSVVENKHLCHICNNVMRRKSRCLDIETNCYSYKCVLHFPNSWFLPPV